MNTELAGEFGKALAIDPKLLPALKGRAQAYFALKDFRRAIADYDRILAIDNRDYGAYHDRGLSKMQLGLYYEAIADFGEAIKIKPRVLQEHYSYESRADAYMKTRQWELAIRDLTTAISLQVGGSLPLMSLDQFRAIYPEYNAASDEAIKTKLNQTFFPNVKYDNSAQGLFTEKPLSSTIAPELYLKRSDAYLKNANWSKAALDFQRAINGFPDYADAVDRWREIARSPSVREYIDMKTLSLARRDTVKLWIKEIKGPNEENSPYTLLRFELNCGSDQMRALSVANYSATGEVLDSHETVGRWGAVTPDSLGELLRNSACLH